MRRRPQIPERWIASRKTELVLRLLRGEPVDVVARECQVPAQRTRGRPISRVFEAGPGWVQ